MLKAISNTSPLLYLYRIKAIELLPQLFTNIWVSNAVVLELKNGQLLGYDVPNPNDYSWINVVSPKSTPSEWLSLNFGAGELETLSLALENTECIVILDDLLARKIAIAAGLNVWGTLKVLVEAKTQGIIKEVAPFIDNLNKTGMWISDNVRKRILKLAKEI